MQFDSITNQPFQLTHRQTRRSHLPNYHRNHSILEPAHHDRIA